MMNELNLRQLLERIHTIAVVGLSNKPHRDSYRVASFLQQQGYRIIPINPNITEVLGEHAYPTLAAVPQSITIDLVDIFRRPDAVGAIVDAAIERGVPAVWMQLGVVNEAAAQRAREAGLQVIMDRCIAVDYRQLGVQRA